MEVLQPQYIEIRQNRDNQPRPYLVGTRVRVQDIVFYHERLGQSPDEIVRGFPHLTLAQVHAALAYYFDNREAIWQCIREDEAYAASVKQQLTGGPVVITGLNVDATDTPVSP